MDQNKDKNKQQQIDHAAEQWVNLLFIQLQHKRQANKNKKVK